MTVLVVHIRGFYVSKLYLIFRLVFCLHYIRKLLFTSSFWDYHCLRRVEIVLNCNFTRYLVTYPDCYFSYGTTRSLKTGNSFKVSANNRWSPLIYSEQTFKCNFYYNDPFPSFAEFCVEKSSVETRVRKPFSFNTMLIRTCVLPPCDEAWRAQILLNYSVFIWGLIVSVYVCVWCKHLDMLLETYHMEVTFYPVQLQIVQLTRFWSSLQFSDRVWFVSHIQFYRIGCNL